MDFGDVTVVTKVIWNMSDSVSCAAASTQLSSLRIRMFQLPRRIATHDTLHHTFSLTWHTIEWGNNTQKSTTRLETVADLQPPSGAALLAGLFPLFSMNNDASVDSTVQGADLGRLITHPCLFSPHTINPRGHEIHNNNNSPVRCV